MEEIKKNIIALSGDPASGKGTVSKILMEKLGFGVYRNGEYFRKLAKKHNMDLAQFSKYVENHPEIDRQIEESAAEYAKTNDNFIIDARLGWYAVPNSFKVHLLVDIDEAAKRAFKDENRKNMENYSSVEEYKNALEERQKSEQQRYYDIYGVKTDIMTNYNLTINTTHMTPEEVADIIIKEFDNYKNDKI